MNHRVLFQNDPSRAHILVVHIRLQQNALRFLLYIEEPMTL